MTRRLALAALIAVMLSARPAWAGEDGGSDRIQPVVATSLLVTSLYGAALGVSSLARFTIAVAVPLFWQETMQTLVVPGVMVLVMSQLIPAARQEVPQLVHQWFDPSVSEARLKRH